MAPVHFFRLTCPYHYRQVAALFAWRPTSLPGLSQPPGAYRIMLWYLFIQINISLKLVEP